MLSEEALSPMRAPTAIVLLLLAPAPLVLAQTTEGDFLKCGDPDLTLVFLNRDLQPHDDGYVHASGSFFIQFQARGDRAFDIESLKFSEGVEANGIASCDTPEWISEGMLLKNFRADYDPEDGFFIPINTCNVPNGKYVAGISVYDKDLNELVRYWTRALVDNGPGSNKEERCAYPDRTAPWPMILPGDGIRKDGGHGLYIEVGEPLSAIDVWVNGVKIAVTEGLGPERDDDLIVDLGYTPALRDSGLTQAQVEKRQYPTYTSSRNIVAGDVVKVRAVDMWGNVAEKIVHVGDPTIGGRATLAAPDFELRIPETDKLADANGTAVYNVTYVTKNEEGLHADLYVRNETGGETLPAGITYKLTPNHVMMGGNEDLTGTIAITATPDAKPGTYRIQFAANYLTGAAREEKVVPLVFRLDAAPTSAQEEEVAGDDAIIPQETVRDGSLDGPEEAPVAPPTPKDTPAPGLLVALAVVGIAAWAARPRR